MSFHYPISGTGFVPLSRTLTINGVAQDLSTNRSWTVAVPTLTSELTNDSGFITSSALASYLPLTGATYTTTTGNGLALTTSTLTSGKLVSLSSTGTGAGSNTQTVLNIATSGANGTSTQTTYGTYVTNTHTGTASTNVAGYFSASGGTNNYGLIVANGNVGIGTTTPGNLLSIVGNSSTPGGVAFDVKNSNVSGDTIFSLSSSNNRTLNLQVTGDSYVVNQKGAYLFTNGGLSNMTFMTDGDVGSGGSGYISFATGGYTLTTQERMRITSTGNIGIGITSPTALLMLAAGTATASTAPLKFTSGTNLTTPEAGVMEYDGTSLFFTPASTRYNVLMNGLGLAGGQTVVGGTASGNNLTLSSTSNATKGKILFGTSAYDEVNNRLGIGTTNPGGILDIYKFDNSNPVLMRIWNGGSGGAKLRFVSETGGTAQHQWTTDKFLAAIAANNTIGMQFRVGLNATEAALDASTRMTITTDGNVGIGTTSPTAVLHLKAGTATAGSAPLKLTAGTNLTTPENGAFEFDGTNLYFTVGGVRKTVTLV